MRKGIARATLGRLREDHAATQLQCVIRKYTQVKKYMQFRNSAIVLQKGSSSTNLLLFLFISFYPKTFSPAITMYLIVSRSGACVLRSAKVRRDEARCGSDHSTNGDAQGEGYEVAQATCVWCGQGTGEVIIFSSSSLILFLLLLSELNIQIGGARF